MTAVLGTEPYVLFRVRVAAVRPLGDSFVRVTFTGDCLQQFADHGDDQRVKLLFPLPGGGLPELTGDWYAAWRELPEGSRNPMRTYTVRAMRPAERELDVDLVRHGDAGPASRWAGSVAPGDEVVVVGPNAACPGDTRAAAWNPPAGTRPFLLLGADETAVPAVAAILERLPSSARGAAVLEVPSAGDVLDLVAPDGVALHWQVRGDRPHGQALEAAVRSVAASLASGAGDDAPLDEDEEILWDVPEEPSDAGVYAWLAGEARCIAALRRHLVRDLGIDRRAVAFMGYWKSGYAEPH